jgi:predicted amidohydrolase
MIVSPDSFMDPGPWRSSKTRDMPSSQVRYTRVAVVQLDYLPAALVERRSPLEDPLFDFGRPDSLLPADGVVPPQFEERLKALRRRIREAYDDQLLRRVRAILGACRSWGVRLCVLPEYSIPWEILGGLADAAGDMVVVAGTHRVDRAARQSDLYRRLGVETPPDLGTSVCPVLHQGRLLALSPKLNAARPEQGSMQPGKAWRPVELPDGIPGPLGVMICLDFLYREGEAHRALVGEALDACRFLAVPSLTPHYTLDEFASKAWEEARRYGRPVLYADIAGGGGTSIYVDERELTDLRRFPDRAGYLERGDEGVIVADVDLGFVRTGRSTRYGDRPAIVPVAEASLVYRAHPIGERYAAFLEELTSRLHGAGEPDLDAAAGRVEASRDLLLNAGALPGAAARQRRLRRLLAEIDNVTHAEELRRFTREVVLPGDLLPLPSLRAALAKGVADVVFTWLRERRGGGMEAVEERLREAGKIVATPDASSWTAEGVRGIAAVSEVVQEPPAPSRLEGSPPADVPARVMLPEGINPAALGRRQHNGIILLFRPTPADLDSFGIIDSDRDVEHLLMTPGLHVSTGLSHELFLQAKAEGAERIAAVAVRRSDKARAAILVVFERGGRWVVWAGEDAWSIPEIEPKDSPWFTPEKRAMTEALEAVGLSQVEIETIPVGMLETRLDHLRPRFDEARAVAQQFRDERLRDVAGQFVEPNVLVDGEPCPALKALDAWLASNEQTALVLGEFGSGKSTTLAEWACRQWDRPDGSRPILCNLAGAGPSADAESLLLKASGLDDTPANRAALLLLIRQKRLLPCFDGFDEMATRLTSADLAGRLSELLRVARDGGRVVISSRDHYFPTEENLRTTSEQALASRRACGGSPCSSSTTSRSGSWSRRSGEPARRRMRPWARSPACTR